MSSRVLTVLLLEDDPYDAALITERLTDGGFDLAVKRVASRAEYLQALQQPWQIVISDYNVPGYSGRDALLEARQTQPRVPFIFVTGALGEERAIELLKLGATDYVLKDRPDRLVASVERALREAKHLEATLSAQEDSRQRAEFEQQLLAVVSHDLRNPINVVLLAAETAMLHPSLEPNLKQLLTRIKNAGERASGMIRDILDFSQARAGTLRVDARRMDLHELATRYVEETEALHPGRRFSLQADGDTFGEWDPDRLGQVLTNLLSNAIRYSPADSTVTITLAGTTDFLALSVHNDGDPIPAELQSRLFKPLARGNAIVNRAVRSVGLGLYIVDKIVRAHHGTVEVTSQAGAGTTFRIRLPRHYQPLEIE